MPRSSVQRQVYDALTEQIIPRAKRGEITPVLAKIPLQVPDSVSVIKIAQPRLTKGEHHPFALNPDRWPDLNLHACRFPCVTFVLDGETDILLGLARQRAANTKIPATEPGIRALSLTNGHCCFFPPLTPYADCSHAHWYRPNPDAAASRSLWIRVLPVGAFLQVSRTHGQKQSETSAILVANSQLLPMTQLLLENLENRPRSSELIQAFLLAFVLNITETWSTNRLLSDEDIDGVRMVNLHGFFSPDAKSPQQNPDLQRACAFIDSHLALPLKISEIALQSYVSAPKLKRLFQSELNISVMQYVLKRRIDEAKSFLAQTDINIEDVGVHCGYHHRTHFSRIFTRAVGMAPREYRKQFRTQKTNPRPPRS